MESAKLQGKGNKLSAKLNQARKNEAILQKLAAEIKILLYWLRIDILFFLRKQLGSDYLELLRFFLNHRTFKESRVPERIGKSPRELMMGEKHPHWLELLGFQRFQRA